MVKVVCWPRQLMVMVAERSSPVVFVCRVIVSVLGPEPPLLGLMSTHVSSEALLVVDTLVGVVLLVDVLRIVELDGAVVGRAVL